MTEKKRLCFKFIKHTSMLMVMTMLLAYVSYSWIRREWTPSVEQSNIKIVTSGALVFQMGEGSGYSDSETINEILGIDDFELKPVSNCTGESDDFFALNFNDEMGWEKYEHLSLANYPDYTTMGKANGYLEFNFVLFAPDGDNIMRYVYLDEAYIKDSDDSHKYYAECVRVSITNKTTNQTWMFGMGDSTDKVAISNEKSGGIYLANGALYYEQYDPITESNSVQATTILYKEGNQRNDTGKELEKPQNYISFSDKNGKNSSGSYDTSKTLFTLDSGNASKGVTIVVRVWLEGADPKCKSMDILEPEIDLKLKFSSFTSAELAAQAAN